MKNRLPRSPNVRLNPFRNSDAIEFGSSWNALRGLAIPLVVIFVVALFLIPIPAALLDLLLVTNIALSLAILLRALWSRETEDLYAFPVLVLLSTLFRLGLNVSSTRLILLHGDQGLSVAGRVIQAFGSFVVSGDFIVGAIVFAVIAVVNFMVITRGSARVAEVSARFTLDSLPGRQLAIDSDQRQGILSAVAAQRKRSDLARENQFFGSMDGAMRFVQGDAIACLIIVAVNALGGVVLGLQRGMSFSGALESFGVLAIGDGLVSIIPALLVSVSAGIVVTNVRSSDDNETVSELVKKLFSDPRTIILAALVMFALGLTPTFPLWPFAIVGCVAFAAALNAAPGAGEGLTFKNISLKNIALRLKQIFLGESAAESKTTDRFSALDEFTEYSKSGGMPPIRVVASPDIFDSARSLWSERFESAFERRRMDLYRRRGVPLAPIVPERNEEFEAGSYQIFIRDRQVRRGTIPAASMFVPLSPGVLATLGIRDASPARYPLSPQGASWVAMEHNVCETLELIGVECIMPVDYLALEVLGAALNSCDELIGVDEVKVLLQSVREANPHITAEVLDRGVITLSELTGVLQQLLRERVSIRDLKVVLEGVASFVSRGADLKDRREWLTALHQHLRSVLARSIVAEAVGSQDVMRVFVLSTELEDEFRQAVTMWDGPPSRPPLEPDREEVFRTSASRMFRPVIERGALPIVVLCAQEIRAGVHEAMRYHDFGGEWYTTLAFEELSWRAPTETVGVLGG